MGGPLTLLACVAAPPGETGEATSPPRPLPAMEAHPLRGLRDEVFVTELLDEDPTFRCDRGESIPERCERDYRALALLLFGGDEAALADCADERTEELLDLRREVEAGAVAQEPAADEERLGEELRSLVEALALAEGGARVRAGPVHAEEGHDRIELLLELPGLGELPGRLLLPAGLEPGRAPGLLMLPGHLPEADSQLDDLLRLRHGARLAGEGMAVLALAFRAYDAGEHESATTVELLCAGASLMAVRQVEASLGLRLLRALREDGADPAVLGHSGGAVSATLLALHQPLDRVVLDAVAEHFVNVQENGPSVQVLDETVPALVPWWDCVYALGLDLGLPPSACARPEPSRPHLYQPYGYAEEDWPALRDFLLANGGG